MNWKLLGIEETKDKKAIKKAYRDKLSGVNPEDKPEEFMELRAAGMLILSMSELSCMKAIWRRHLNSQTVIWRSGMTTLLS